MKLRELHDELVGLNDNLKPSERVDEQTIDALGQLVTDLGDLVENLKESGAPDEYREQKDDLAKRIEYRPARGLVFRYRGTGGLGMRYRSARGLVFRYRSASPDLRVTVLPARKVAHASSL